MTANYNFQHNILRQAIEALPSSELKALIITQDTARAQEIFYEAMKRAHLDLFLQTYKFNCEFTIKNNLPMLVYYFDNEAISGSNIVAECFAAVAVPTTRSHYYTVENSLENNVAVGEWVNGAHRNYGFYDFSEMGKIIDFIANHIKTNITSTTPQNKYTNAGQSTLITSVLKLQKIIVAVLSLLLVLIIAFPIVTAIVKNETIPSYSTKAKITELDATQTAYCETRGQNNYIYIKVNNRIKVYEFSNATMYYPGSKNTTSFRKGYATTSELKEYFGANIVSGVPPLSYAAPALLPVGFSILAIVIVILILLCISLRKKARAALFTLTKKNELFINNKKAFDDEIISKYEYVTIQKNLFSQKILKNNKFFNLFKILY